MKEQVPAQSEKIDQAPENSKTKRINEVLTQMDMVKRLLEKQWGELPRSEKQQSKERKLLDILDKIFDEAGYIQRNEEDEGIKINELIEAYSEKYKEFLPMYTKLVKEVLVSEREDIHRTFTEAEAGKSVDPEIKSELEKNVIYTNRELTPEQIQVLREAFPSGNFLLHTAGVKESILIIESGQILSSIEVAKNRKEEWGSGGGAGISFNMNDVRVLQGDRKHFMGFLADPQAIIGENTRLVIPEDAAEFEMRLVPQSYEREFIVGTPDQWGKYPEEEMPRIPVDNTLIFCNELDIADVIEILAASGRRPKGIVAYPNREIRIRSWQLPGGDHEVASEFIHKTLARANIKASIDWNRDLFPRTPDIRNHTYVSDEDINNSFSIVRKNDTLYIDDGEHLQEIVLHRKGFSATTP